MNQRIYRAVRIHFAITGNLKACEKLEDSVHAAKAFYEHLVGSGSEENSELFKRLMGKFRYRNKLALIKRYLK
jgi:hypothetical protein